MKITQGTIIILGLFVMLLLSSFYTVDQRETAIKFRFKEVIQKDIQPGLHFKWPTSIIHTIKKFPSQILTFHADKRRILTGEKKYVLVDFFVEWKIKDTHQFYLATRGNLGEANRLLGPIMTAGLRSEFGRRTIKEAMSDQRGQIMQGLHDKSAKAANDLGIKVVDVRVSRIDFPETISESVYERMRSERVRVATDFRSRGKEEAEKIKANADKQATVIEATAYSESEALRGQGDAVAAANYAKAYQQDAEFYSFYRSLNAYKNSLGKDGDVMVLDPNSEFFKFFKAKGKSVSGANPVSRLNQNNPVNRPIPAANPSRPMNVDVPVSPVNLGNPLNQGN